MIDALEKMLAQGRDDALLRFGLGNAYLNEQQPEQAIIHFQACIQHQADYSAAWKLLGKAYQALGQTDDAVHAYQQGISAAQSQGDKQAEREMAAFLKKLNKN